nr:prephenate dehydrogenase/arogenate dehydrogenase family protein [Methylomonas koyamae]
MQAIFAQLKPYWNPQAIYSDAGSTKGSVVEAARAVFGEVPSNFVPAHPIAGAERSGVEAAMADLYRNRRVIVTPLPNTDPQAADRLSELWQRIGASVSVMAVEHHDTVLAATSHLPHILAFAWSACWDARMSSAKFSNMPPAVSRTSAASPLAIRPCGRIFVWPINRKLFR